MKAYLAGPDVFLPEAVAVGSAKKALCARYGIEGLYPFDQTLDGLDSSAAATAIFESNLAMMRAADVIVADLSPFRSVSADPGTAFELGYVFALGKPVYGYSDAAADLFGRMTGGAPRKKLHTLSDGRTLHADGLVIEDFGLPDNLMLIEAIAASGGAFFAGPGGRWSAPEGLSPFEACLAAIAATANPHPGEAAPSTFGRLAG